jgi:hypothetical protein
MSNGYDAKAVKVPKSIKRTASYIDPHKRGAYIRSFVKILETAGRSRTKDTAGKESQR